MAKKQTRRSISVMAQTYARLARWCRSNGRSVSGHLEDIIAADMKARGQPEVTREEALGLPRRPRADPDGKTASGIFTF